jgi:hypothetical protein
MNARLFLVGLALLAPAVLQDKTRSFSAAIELEKEAFTSANASLGDLDSDGDLDIVLAKGRHWPLNERVLLNDGKGGFRNAHDLAAAPDRTYSAVLADLDGDRDLDLAVSNDVPDRKLIYLNDGKGSFRIAGSWGEGGWSTRNAAVADLNGDGKLDLIAANRPGPSFVCFNDGQANFSNCKPVPAPSATTIVPADFNRDGFIDLAIPQRDGGQSHVYLNDGKGGFGKAIEFGPPNSATRTAAAGDLNGDGAADLVVGDERQGAFIYLNDGKGKLDNTGPLGEAKLVPYAVAVADLNLDRGLDVVIGYVEAPSAAYFNGGQAKHFEAVRFGDNKGAVYGLAIGDVNGDRFPDVVAARSDATNVLYLSQPARK